MSQDDAYYHIYQNDPSADENPQGRKKAATRANTVQKAIEPPTRFDGLPVSSVWYNKYTEHIEGMSSCETAMSGYNLLYSSDAPAIHTFIH